MFSLPVETLRQLNASNAQVGLAPRGAVHTLLLAESQVFTSNSELHP